MNKKPTYILLKDLPDTLAGAVVTGYNTMSYTYRNKNNVVNTYHKSIVENNPDWFQLQQPKEEQEIALTKEKLDAMMDNVFKEARKAVPLYDHIRYEYFDFKEYQASLPENKQSVYKEKSKYPNQEKNFSGLCDIMGIKTQTTSNASINCTKTEREKYYPKDVMGCYFAMGGVDDKRMKEYLERIKE